MIRMLVVILMVSPCLVSAGEWLQVHPKPTAAWLKSVVSGNDRLVAVGTNGTVLTSEEGVVWSSQNIATTADLNDVVWTGERFLAVGNQITATSENGISWTVTDIPDNLISVAYDGDIFRAIGNYNLIFASDDGVLWAEESMPTVQSLDEIMWANGTWVAVGSDILSKPTGQDWAVVVRDAFCGAITHNGSLFLAVGYYSSTWLSEDGVSWTVHDGPWWSSSLNTVGWDGTQFIAAGGESQYHGIPGLGGVETSPDGISWSPKPYVPRSVHGLVWHKSLWVGVGYHGLIVTSAHGERWSMMSQPTMPGRYSISFNGRELLAGGGQNGIYGCADDVLISEDGVSFGMLSPSDNEVLSQITWTGSVWLAITSCVTGNDRVATSLDGLEWEYTNTSEGWADSLFAVAASPNIMVVVGERIVALNEYSAFALASHDGNEWNEMTIDSPSSLRSVAWNGGQFVAVGEDGLVVRSETGFDWHVESPPQDDDLWIIEGGDGLFVAAGARPELLLSKDGRSWETVELEGNAMVTELKWTGERWIMALNDNRLLESSNARVWSPLTSIPFAGLTEVSEAFDSIFAATSHGEIFRFQDSEHLIEPSEIRVIPVAAHRAGVGDITWQTDLQLLSRDQQWAEVWLSVPEADSSSLTSHEKRIFVPPGGQLLRSDVLYRSFGFDDQAGPIVIRSKAPILVTTRTYSKTDSGSFGQSIPCFDVGSPGQVIIAQLTDNVKFRSNIGATNLGPEPVTLSFELRDAQGGIRGETEVNLGAFAWMQSGRLLRELAGGPIDDAYLVVRSAPAGAPYYAYGSVVDNFTDDPSFIRPALGSSNSLVLAVVVNGPGLARTYWRTDVEVVNASDDSLDYHLEFLAGERVVSDMYTLAPRAAHRHRDVVDSVFHRRGAAPLIVVPERGEIVVTSRTATDWQDGSYGQFIPAVDHESTLTDGESLHLLGLGQSADPSTGNRSNIGLVNLGADEIPVEVELYYGDGSIAARIWRFVAPYSLLQLVEVFTPYAPVENGYATIRSLDDQAHLLVYASVIDNQSGDPVYIEAR